MIQHHVTKFVSDFSSSTQVSSTNKTDRQDITEILLKVALNTIELNQLHQFIYHSVLNQLHQLIYHSVLNK
jgi:hypothetical protein